METKILSCIFKNRCIIINNYKDITIEKQIKDFRNLGFNYIIVCQNKYNPTYKIGNLKKYLNNNKEILMEYLKKENNYEPKNWNYEIQHDDNIFKNKKLLLTNFLKWCCTK